MAVPAHDSRDYAFARHFDLPVIPLIEGCDVSEQSFDAKSGKMINSASAELDLNGMEVKDAIAATKKFIEEKGIGRVKVNYRLRDAIFSRQRYWGEPFPYIIRKASPPSWTRASCRCCCPRWTNICPPRPASPAGTCQGMGHRGRLSDRA